VKKEFTIKDSSNKTLVTYYYDGDNDIQVPKIKQNLLKLINFVLQIITMNYEKVELEDIYDWAEVLDEELCFILHKETIAAISDIHNYPKQVQKKLILLGDTIRLIIDNNLDKKMKQNHPKWVKVSNLANDILNNLEIKALNPSEFLKNENLSMDWL